MARILIAIVIGVLWPLSLNKIPLVNVDGSYKSVVNRYFLIFSTIGASSALVGINTVGTVGAILWSIACVYVALVYFLNFLGQKTYAPIEIAAFLSPAFVAFGSFWLIASNAEIGILDFGPTIILLTVAHFHATGGCLMVLASLNGRLRKSRFNGFICALILIGIPCTALGITIGGRSDGIGATPTIIAAALLAISQIIGIGTYPIVRRILVICSSLSLLIAMGLAFAYSLQHYGVQTNLSIDEMVNWHASFNVFGFIGLGLISFYAFENKNLS